MLMLLLLPMVAFIVVVFAAVVIFVVDDTLPLFLLVTHFCKRDYVKLLENHLLPVNMVDYLGMEFF